MTYWDPKVIKIKKVSKHPNADSLDIVDVDFPCIVRLGQYKKGDLVSYIPVDTMVNINNPVFSFLQKDGISTSDKLKYTKIKAKKLRGIYSEGLIVDAPSGFEEEQSITEHFGLKKFVYPDEVEEYLSLSEKDKANLFFPELGDVIKIRPGNAESPPKGWQAMHYDLDPLRLNTREFIDGEEVVLTEKLDGCSAFYRHDGERLWVKSRNLFKKFDPLDLWWGVAIRNDFENLLKNYSRYGFFGESRNQVKPFYYDAVLENGKVYPKFSLFDVYDYNEFRFLDYDEIILLAKEIGLETVPELYRGPWKEDKSLFALAEQDSLLKPILPQATTIMEGFVIRPVKERSNRKGRVVYKFKSQRYLLIK
jgi:tRNA-binding EMAP/Myf-like protein